MTLKLDKSDKVACFAFVCVVFFAIIIVTAYFFWMRNATTTTSTIEMMKHVSSSDINRVVIDRSRINKTKNLVLTKLEIYDPETIERIWSGFKLDNKYEPPHPISEWLCLLEVDLKNGERFVVRIKKLKKLSSFGERGSLITFYSHVESGWFLGEYRSDKLGEILESMAKERGVYNEKGILND